jgi:uncharacterized protein (DUF58 family)
MRWFLGAAVLLGIALAFDLGLLAYAMYVLIGVRVVSRFLALRWANNLSATRECSRYTARVGDVVAVVVQVRNRGLLPIPWVLLEDLLPRHAFMPPPARLEMEGSRLQLSMFGSRGKQSVLYQLHCRGRGYFQIGPLVLETGDLFGLHRRYRVVTAPHFLMVYPEIVPLLGYDVASRRPLGEVRMSFRLYEDPTRIAGVRGYVPGDPYNRIHWRATARTGALHCKVYEPSTIAGATILLDFHQDSFDPKHEPYRSELVITASASIAHALYQMGEQVGLVTNGRDAADRIRQEGWDADPRSRREARHAAAMSDQSDRLRPVIVETDRGPEQFGRILDTLTRLEQTDGLHMPALIYETAARLPRNATVLAILTAVPVDTAMALGGLRRRGFAVTALVSAYYDHEFEAVAGPLAAQGIYARHLKDRESVAAVCENYVLGQ